MASENDARKPDSIDDIVERIQSQGERITIQRRLVIEALWGVEGYLSIGAIQRVIQENHPVSALPEPTIYRILQWLKDMHIVSQTDMGQTGIVYQLLARPHHHLICLACGHTSDLPDDCLTALRERLRHEFGFAARIDHMAIYGLCRACAANAEPTDR